MKKALFLDRDGVINYDFGYVHQIDNFEFMPQIFELCKAAIENNYIIIVVTNQAGIGRGFYDEETFLDLTNSISEIFLDNDINITKTYFVPIILYTAWVNIKSIVNAENQSQACLIRLRANMELI